MLNSDVENQNNSSIMNKRKSLSLIVPVYNEEKVIDEFYKRSIKVLESLKMDYEIIFINDGSNDKTLEKLIELRNVDNGIAIVDLSRNFGKEVAMTSGIDYAKGDAVVIIDSDLQDPPELIPEFVRYWLEGYDVVYAKRISRAGETALKKLTAHLFYRTINKISRVAIPEDTGDFRLLSRRAVNAIKEFPERSRFMKGLFSWIGFSQKEVVYNRDSRFSGTSKWGYWNLWNFALEGITSFTVAPLKLSTYVGILTAILAMIYGLFIIIRTLIYGDPVAGYPTLISIIILIGGIQLVALGIIGEYLGRMFEETKNRPLYFVKKYSSSNLSVDTIKPTISEDD